MRDMPRVEVRSLTTAERGEAQAVMITHHYLHTPVDPRCVSAPGITPARCAIGPSGPRPTTGNSPSPERRTL